MKVTEEQNVSTHKPIEKVEEVVVIEVNETISNSKNKIITAVGSPAPIQCPNLGKRVLNSLKDFFGVGKVENCYDY